MPEQAPSSADDPVFVCWHDPHPVGMEGLVFSLREIHRAWKRGIFLESMVFRLERRRYLLKDGKLWRIRMRPSSLKENLLDYDLMKRSRERFYKRL